MFSIECFCPSFSESHLFPLFNHKSFTQNTRNNFICPVECCDNNEIKNNILKNVVNFCVCILYLLWIFLSFMFIELILTIWFDQSQCSLSFR